MKPSAPTNSPAEPEDERPGDGGAARYVRLLDENAGPELWEEFSRDVKNVCLRQPDLRADAEEWAQQILLKVYEDLSKLKQEEKNPWFYALRVMELKKYEAVRKNIKARQAESLTRDEQRGEKVVGVNEPATAGGGEATGEIDEINEGGTNQTEEDFIRNFEECLAAALAALPERKSQLVEDYYSLNTHDRKKRERLAESYRLKSYTSLQTMMSRLSDDLVGKVDECMEQGGFVLSEFLAGKEGRGLVKKYIKNLLRR